MKRELTFTLVAIFCFLSWAKAQRHEVGIQMGMSNLVGDIGSTNYVLQKPVGNISDYGLPFYAGIMYRMNFNPYQTIRLNVGYNNIQFNDNYAKENYRRARKLSGTNSVVSADLVFEYNNHRFVIQCKCTKVYLTNNINLGGTNGKERKKKEEARRNISSCSANTSKHTNGSINIFKIRINTCSNVIY